jgi:DNA-binding response OmpR family regulator
MSGAAPLLEGGRFGRFEILLAERRLNVDGQPVALGSRAFDLLAALVTRRNRIVPKDELIEVVWPGLVVEDNNLQVQISALRKVLGTQAIATVPGRGYQFTVAAVAQASTAPEAKAPRLPERAGAVGSRPSRLLVADDNKVNRLLLCRSLELMGHEVASAENGRAALEKLRSERFDLLLLDLEMPEVDGFSLLEQRADDAVLLEIPVIVTSSLEGVVQVARCIELGADDYLHKPVNPVLLKARVGSSLERKHLRDRQRELLARLAPELPAGSPAASGVQGGRRVQATLLQARLRDVEALSPPPSADEALELLSNWSTLMLAAIEGQAGLVLHLSGDGVAAVFGAGAPATGAGDAAWAAVLAAEEMHALMAQFNAERSASGKPPAVLSIGIASGEVIAGPAGTPRRAAYVCVGAAVQRAAGLEALASASAVASADHVLMDDATQAALSGRAATVSLPPVVLPGRATAVSVYRLAGATTGQR